jgi:hypothetical protein
MTEKKIKISQYQLDLMVHTLGGTNKDTWCRNHFAASKDHEDYDDLISLANMELMGICPPPSFMPEDCIVFVVTDKGKEIMHRISEEWEGRGDLYDA